jgi:outer membrane lipoprotein-sorting protein
MAGMLLSAVVPALAADDLGNVLSKLDAAALKFKSAQADIVWDNVQTEPLPDKDSQTGTIFFKRQAGEVEVALRLKADNGQPIEKDILYGGGVLKLYEPKLKQMQVFKAGENKAQYDMFFTVGFGGSGKDLQKSWNVTYAGTEQVDGVTTSKLNLVPKDANLAKTVPRVVIWLNADTGIALKEQSFDASGNYRMVTYHGVKVNQPMPADSFEIKPAAGTQIVNR